jgi:hypothetical protein
LTKVRKSLRKKLHDVETRYLRRLVIAVFYRAFKVWPWFSELCFVANNEGFYVKTCDVILTMVKLSRMLHEFLNSIRGPDFWQNLTSVTGSRKEKSI